MVDPVPLEDELGDVLEKAMRRAGLNDEALGERTGVAASRIQDAINYRPDLSASELCRLAHALGLNEIGLCALGSGHYPLPRASGLPFCVYPLRTRHGIGVVNAYLVSECGSSSGILFDTGPGIDALELVWPRGIRKLDAIYLTHVEGEHVGGLCEIVARFGVAAAFCPLGGSTACSRGVGEGETHTYDQIRITAFSTPGHTSAHNCYLVESLRCPDATPLLISGDLFFAGSIGTALHCPRQLASNLRRMLDRVPLQTVIAPGHGPMTTAENE